MQLPFYERKIYDGVNTPRENEEVNFNLLERQKILDKVILADSRDLKQYVNDGVVSLIVTSPPYNVGMSYEDDLNLQEYLDFLEVVWKECYRMLRIGGRLVFNVTDIGRKIYIPMHCHVMNRILSMKECIFLPRAVIGWMKGENGTASSLPSSWGSWCSPSDPCVRDIHEYILVFSKISNKLKKTCSEPDITPKMFLECSKSIWTFPSVSAKSIGHPAPFPVELPARAIKFYTYPNDLVVDVFNGSGTTCVAAKMARRHYLGFDISNKYVDLSIKRLKKFKNVNKLS